MVGRSGAAGRRANAFAAVVVGAASATSVAAPGVLAGCSPAGSVASSAGPGGPGDAGAGPEVPTAPCSQAARSVYAALGRGDVCDAFAPVVLSVDPLPGSTSVDPTAAVTLVFSRPVTPPASASAIAIVDDRGPVPVTLSWPAPTRAVLVPRDRLALLGAYTISVDGVAGVEGVPMRAPFTSSFTVRDGRWVRQPPIEDAYALNSATVAAVMNDRGDAVVVVARDVAGDGSQLELRALLFHPDSGWTPPVPLTAAAPSMDRPSIGAVAIDDAGDALVVWCYDRPPDPGTALSTGVEIWASVERGGVWAAPHQIASRPDQGRGSIAAVMAPDGSAAVAYDLVTYQATPQDGTVLVTDARLYVTGFAADGVWFDAPDPDPGLSTPPPVALALRPGGQLVALHQATKSLAVARFAAGAHAWTLIADDALPGTEGPPWIPLWDIATDTDDDVFAIWQKEVIGVDNSFEFNVVVSALDPSSGQWLPPVLLRNAGHSGGNLSARSRGPFIVTTYQDATDTGLRLGTALHGPNGWSHGWEMDVSPLSYAPAAVDRRGNLIAFWDGQASDPPAIGGRYVRATDTWAPIPAVDGATIMYGVWGAVAGDGTALRLVPRAAPSGNGGLIVDLFQ